MACGAGVAKRAVMVVEVDIVGLAEISEAIGLVARIAPSHPRTGAELGKPKAPLEALILIRDKSVVKIHIVGDEDSIAHELQKAIGDFGEERRAAHHVIRDADQPNDICRDWPLRIEQGMPLGDHLMIANFDRANLGDAITRCPAAGGFKILVSSIPKPDTLTKGALDLIDYGLD
jgi:hypothetical protein